MRERPTALRARASRARPTIVRAAVAAAVFSALGAARAATGGVVLDVARCPEVSEPAIRRIVGIEIGDLLADPAAAAPVEPDRLTVRCQSGDARLEALGFGQPAPIERALRLTDFPGDAAPRAIALAGIEMLASMSPAVRERLRSRPPPGTAVSTSIAGGPTPGRSKLRIAVSAVRREFLSDAGLGAWGGRLDVDRDFGARWLLTGDLEAAFGRAAASLGDTSGLLISLGGFWGLHGGGRRVAGSLSLGGRVGLARLVGTPAGGSSALGASALRPWWGPALSLRGALGGGPVALLASVEAGITVRGADGLAGATTVLAVSGAWLTAGAGVQF